MPLEIKIQPTNQFVNVDGRETRLWIGTTPKGHQCLVLVARVGMRESNSEGCEELAALEDATSPAPFPIPAEVK